MAVGQHQWYHFGVGAPPILDHFSWWGLGCSLGVRGFDPNPYVPVDTYGSLFGKAFTTISLLSAFVEQKLQPLRTVFLGRER